MVNVVYQPPFVTKADFQHKNPLRCRIIRVELVDRKEGPDLQIYFEESERLDFTARLSCWGKNKKAMIDALGNETDNWAGAKFDLFGEEDADGKYYKKVQNVRKA